MAWMARLQPECLASAWSMWSRKPIPVLMEISCDEVVCAACSPASESALAAFGRGARRPPSRFKESWILVSLVSRERVALRAVEVWDAMF